MADPSVSTCTVQLRRDSAEGTCNKRSYINTALSLNESIRKDNNTTIGPVDQDPDPEIFN